MCGVKLKAGTLRGAQNVSGVVSDSGPPVGWGAFCKSRAHPNSLKYSAQPRPCRGRRGVNVVFPPGAFALSSSWGVCEVHLLVSRSAFGVRLVGGVSCDCGLVVMFILANFRGSGRSSSAFLFCNLVCLPVNSRSKTQLSRTRKSFESVEPWRRRDVPRAGRRPPRRAARGRRSVRPSAARRGAGRRSAAPAGASPRRVATTSEAIVHGVRSRCECFPGQWASAGDRSRLWLCCGVLDFP